MLLSDGVYFTFLPNLSAKINQSNHSFYSLVDKLAFFVDSITNFY